MPEHLSGTSVNKAAVQNVWWHHFLHSGSLSEVGETVAHILPQEVQIAAFQEFYKCDRVLTACPMTQY